MSKIWWMHRYPPTRCALGENVLKSLHYRTERCVMSKAGLLDRLAHAAGCMYLSDLHTTKYGPSLHQAVLAIDPAEYSLSEWQEAARYVSGRELLLSRPGGGAGLSCSPSFQELIRPKSGPLGGRFFMLSALEQAGADKLRCGAADGPGPMCGAGPPDPGREARPPGSATAQSRSG